MTEKVGRNDPCPCGSGKKYKNCHMLKKEEPVSLKRKFTAKLISGGGQPQQKPSEEQQAFVDYNLLMERSFGNAIHENDKPPVPPDPSKYLVEDKES